MLYFQFRYVKTYYFLKSHFLKLNLTMSNSIKYYFYDCGNAFFYKENEEIMYLIKAKRNWEGYIFRFHYVKKNYNSRFRSSYCFYQLLVLYLIINCWIKFFKRFLKNKTNKVVISVNQNAIFFSLQDGVSIFLLLVFLSLEKCFKLQRNCWILECRSARDF